MDNYGGSADQLVRWWEGCTDIQLLPSHCGRVLQHLMDTKGLLIFLTTCWIIWGNWLI